MVSKISDSTALSPSRRPYAALPTDRRPYWVAAFGAPLFVAAIAWVLQNELQLDIGRLTAFAVLFSLLAVCAVTDAIWRIIPNWATYTATIWAVTVSTANSWGIPAEAFPEGPFFIHRSVNLPVSIADCVAGLFACFFIMLVIHSIAKGGAGDVKLATAIGALIGLKSGVLALCYTFILAGIASLVVVTWRLGPFFLVAALTRRIGNALLPLYISPPSTAQSTVLQRPLPLGVFFALGTTASVFELPELMQ